MPPEDGPERRTSRPSNATIVRPLADFAAPYGLGEPGAAAAGRRRGDRRAGGRLRPPHARPPDPARPHPDPGRVGRRGARPRARRRLRGAAASTAASSCCATRRASSSASWRASRTGSSCRPAGEVPVSRTMLQAVMRERVALVTYDAQSDQRLSGRRVDPPAPDPRRHVRPALVGRAASSASSQVDSPFQVGAFGERDLDFLTTLANYAAVAVERIRYAQQAEYERQMRTPARALPLAGGDRGGAARERRGGHAAPAGSPRRRVLFADLVGFTAFAENSPPEEVAEPLGAFLDLAVEAIFRGRRHARQVHRRLRDGLLRRARCRSPTTPCGRCARRSRSSAGSTGSGTPRARRGACRRFAVPGGAQQRPGGGGRHRQQPAASTTRCSATRSTSPRAWRPSWPAPATWCWAPRPTACSPEPSPPSPWAIRTLTTLLRSITYGPKKTPPGPAGLLKVLLFQHLASCSSAHPSRDGDDGGRRARSEHGKHPRHTRT